MLYVTTMLRYGSEWGLGARLYLRSLALASERAGLPFRLLWTAPCSTDSVAGGAAVQSFGDVMDPSVLPKSLRALRPHFGPGSSPQPADCMLFVGEVTDAVERISHPDECPPKNVVLTTWPASTLPPHLAVRLSAYDLVLVPEGEGRVFADADVPYVVEVPWPAPTSSERMTHAQKPPADVSRLLCAAGTWQGVDCVEHVAEAFVAAFRRQDGVGLVLACPDVPRQWIKDTVIKRGKATLPFITMAGAFGLWDDPAAIDAAVVGSQAFVDASRRVAPSFWRRRAESLGCPILPAFSATLTGYGGKDLWPGVSPAQAWRELLSVDELARLLRDAARTERADCKKADGSEAGAAIAALVKRVVAGEKLREIARPLTSSGGLATARPSPRAEDGIGVVVPFGGEDVTGLRQCLVSLLIAKREQDKIVVSVRGEPSPAVKLCEELKSVLCVHGGEEGERWNMSAARNAGACFLATVGGLAHVAFVDADVVVPPDYLKRLAREAYKRPGMVLVPYAIDEGCDVSTARIASGMAMFPLDVLIEARGFDEEYVGWGEEDLDLLHRLREMRGVAAVPLPNAPPVIHTPHAPRAGSEQKQRDHEANLARYEAVAKRLDAGEQVVVNSGTWGIYTILAAPLAGMR